MFSILKTYYGFIFRHYKWNFAVFALLLTGAFASESVLPYFYKLLVDTIKSGEQSLSVLIPIVLFYLGFRLISMVLDISARFFGDTVLLPLARDVRVAVFEKVQQLDFAYHLSKSTGSLISAFKRGDTALFHLFMILQFRLLRITVELIVISAFLFTLQPILMFMMVTTFAVNTFGAVFLIRMNISARRKFNDAEDRNFGIIVDNMLNYETVKLFAREQAEMTRLKEDFVDWLQRVWRYANTFRLIEFVAGSLGNIGFGLVLIYSVVLFQKGSISLGDIVMIIGFISSFYVQFFEIIFALRDLAKFQVDLEKYFAALHEPVKVIDPETAQPAPQQVESIAFQDVHFTYHQGSAALQGVDLSIPRGESIALVGKSGAGKSSFVKLLLRFFDVDSGSIRINDIDIRDFQKSDLRSLFGVVPQEPILFNNTMRFNITYAAENVTEKELQKVIKMARLEEVIADLPDGLETQVGERGVKLSGGQKQRLAIARMLLSDPEVVIFDEATSQLDSESEQKIQEAFWAATENKTTIVIAHRLSTVVRADRIIVLDNGKIAEQGSHRDLLKLGGLYAHYWQLQTLDE